jgi:hypothetical protein
MGKGNGKLTPPKRPTGIGGTDAVRLANGEWKDLWLEKIGKIERKDLSGVLPVQLGVFTEEFNRRWYQEVTGERVVNINSVWTHPEYEYTIERDKPFLQKLEIACHLFWFHVMNDITPPEYVDFDLMGKIKNEHDIALHFGEEISTDSWLEGKLN